MINYDIISKIKTGGFMILIFSKDRPLQLSLLLESLEQNCVDFNFSIKFVIYKASDERIEKMYQKIAEDYPYIFHRQTDFKEDVLACIQGFEYAMFLTDDTVITNPFSCYQMEEALQYNQKAIGFSMRLGKNSTYCYAERKSIKVPQCYRVGDSCIFSWPGCEGDWGYPLELSSSVYRIHDLMYLLKNGGYDNPNELEWLLYCGLGVYAVTHPELLFFENSVAFSNPVNIINPSNNRVGHNPNNSIENLLNKFEEGYTIDYEPFRGFVPMGVHQEVDYSFIKEGDPL
jgi:hypothetical protein